MTSEQRLQHLYAEHRRQHGRKVALQLNDTKPQPRSAGRPKSYKDDDMVAEQHMCGARTDRGYNMGTSSGRPFWPASPHIDDVRIGDIANGLCRICRFNGQLDPNIEHYSVAQHSVLVSYIVPPEYAIEGLMHDAAEAYAGDMIRPLKKLDTFFQKTELTIDQVIRAKYGLPALCSDVVKRADNIAVATERRDLLPEQIDVDWGEPVEPHPEIIRPMRAFQARDLFFARALELGLKEVR